MEERERKLAPSGLNRTCMGAEEECPQPVALDGGAAEQVPSPKDAGGVHWGNLVGWQRAR